MDKWTNKMESIHALEFHSAVKGNEALTLTTVWKDPGNVMLSASHRHISPHGVCSIHMERPDRWTYGDRKVKVTPGPWLGILFHLDSEEEQVGGTEMGRRVESPRS